MSDLKPETQMKIAGYYYKQPNNQLLTQVMDAGQRCINPFSCREGVCGGNYTQTSVPAPKMLLYKHRGS